ncbi:MAG: hypothetical protein IT444_11340 [Phycisphaeraceae bacterium]|nr:hypothetical protein [Phycisphaeraceae bacterium]
MAGQVRNFRTCRRWRFPHLPSAPLAHPWRWGGPRRVLGPRLGPTYHRARRRAPWRPVGRSGQTFFDLPFAIAHKQKPRARPFPRPSARLLVVKEPVPPAGRWPRFQFCVRRFPFRRASAAAKAAMVGG